MNILSIIIPVYNEKNTLKRVLAAVEASEIGDIRKDVVIVDDGSTDGTCELLRQLEGKYTIVYHEQNKGKGGALKTGLAKAQGEYILIQDADLEYDPADYKALIEPVTKGSAEVVFGSRILNPDNISYSKVFFYGGLIITKLFNGFFGTKLTDVPTCYKLFPATFIPQLLLGEHNDFVFDVIELTHILAAGGEIKEVPIHYRSRTIQEGKKMQWRQGIKCLAAMMRLKMAQKSSSVPVLQKEESLSD